MHIKVAGQVQSKCKRRQEVRGKEKSGEKKAAIGIMSTAKTKRLCVTMYRSQQLQKNLQTSLYAKKLLSSFKVTLK